MTAMRLDTSQQTQLRQVMILAPRMIQSMEILQLPIMELQERIQQELQENPVLELRETREDASEAEEDTVPEPLPDPDGPSDLERELVVKEDGNHEEDFDRLENLARDYEEIFSEEHRPSRGRLDEEADRRHDVMQNTPSRPQSLDDYLFEQLAFLDLTPQQADFARYLISNLDDRGYLRASLAELVAAYEQPISLDEAERVLRQIQRLDPPGIAARDLKECLLLQITSETPYADVLRTLIQNHLEDLEHNRLPVIQKKTGIPLETIQAAREQLRHFNPRPGAAFAADPIPYVVPDVIVERNEKGDYEVRLVDDYIPDVYISRRYVEMLRNRNADPKTREYLRKKVQSAQWLLDSIEQRRDTLEKITRAIVNHQKAFLDHGPEYIAPLKMQQIADQVGVHVTTVSRAVDDKWVQTPRGIFPLKRFFGGGTQTLEGEDVAWELIKQKLLDIIANEDKANPLSDEDLVRKLSEAGYPVARRTVTKYRKLLKIPSSRQRKDWTLAKTSRGKNGDEASGNVTLSQARPADGDGATSAPSRLQQSLAENHSVPADTTTWHDSTVPATPRESLPPDFDLTPHP
ncbi:MAG: RNA polymerase factor sigma-54 [Gemmatales bacterium]|nr:RNA polymerase factor sigma-54 [Gemmatales bacterium]MDW8386561.1 RNA polymerase factor sigma-54 [Gemmatales bacterium]